MLIIFIFSLSILIYIFVGYPLFLLLLSALLYKRVSKQDILPTVSLIISAYNEEKIIREKIDNSLNIDYPEEKLEIIVASESTDETNKIVRTYENKGVVLYAFKNREGKRATLYRTVPMANGEIIVFSDANTMYKKDAIKKIVRNFADTKIGCVSGRLEYVNYGNSQIGKGEATYWEFDLKLKLLCSKMLSMGGGVNGAIFAVRKELYDPINKFRGDDFEISCRIEINGYGVVLEPDAIAFEEPSGTSKQEFNRKVRLATWNLKSTLMLLREALQKKRLLTALILFSHRFLRYTTPLWLISIFISNVFLIKSNPIFLYAFVLQLILYTMAFLGFIQEKTSAKSHLAFIAPFYFCMVNCAAFRALINNLFGKEENYWEKAR